MRLVLPRVYPLLDTAALERAGCTVVEGAEALLDGGAGILQFRHKGFWSNRIFEEADAVGSLCRAAEARFIVNDRADYAMLLNRRGIEAGLHVGQDDLLPGDARMVVGNGPVLGLSTHNEAQVREGLAEPVDYLAFGPIFGTGSKENPDPVVGLERLRAIRSLVSLPVVAIGGINPANAELCWIAGADSVAIIAGLLPNPCTPGALRARMAEWNRIAG